MPFIPEVQMSQAAKMVSEAERIHMENRVLRSGLKLSDDDMEKAKRLAFIAMQSGDPGGFLNAVVVMVTPSPYKIVPCFCWWCRLKRWLRGEKDA